MNSLIHESKLRKGCICRLRQFQANYVKDKYILVLIDVEILEEYGEPEKLGCVDVVLVARCTSSLTRL